MTIIRLFVKLVHSLTIILFLVLLSACNNENNKNNSFIAQVVEQPIENSNTVKILSFNIHAGRTADGVLNLDAMAEVINQLEPNFVALQEVDVDTNRSGKIDMAALLAEKTSMHYAFGKAMDYDGGQYGNAILSKIPLGEIENIKLPEGKEPRAALRTNTMFDNNTSINIISTHFDAWNENNRINSAQLLNDKVSSNNQLYLLAGDFNDLPESSTISTLTAYWGISDPEGSSPTFPASLPTKKIDYILFYPKERWTVISTQVIANSTVSDHRPYLVTLKLNK